MSKMRIEVIGIEDWALLFPSGNMDESRNAGTASILVREKGSGSFRKIELPERNSIRLFLNTFSYDFISGKTTRIELRKRSTNVASAVLSSLGLSVKKAIILELSNGVSALVFYDGPGGDEKRITMDIEEFMGFALNCPKEEGFKLFVGSELMETLPESQENPGDELLFKIPLGIKG